MPAMMDDPDSPTIYRVSGAAPLPDPHNPVLPADVVPRHVTLRDRQTVATIIPFASRHQVPASLLVYLSDQFNKEIEGGDTYPMMEPMSADKFASYWFQNFGVVMLLGDLSGAADVIEGSDWARQCLGAFYIKPNYPGRSSHVCNAGFLVTPASRNRGVGRLMGEAYLDWAPRLGYTYSVFNLVYETNVASCRIWDALGFKRIGRVKGCGNLKSYPDRYIDAIIYGRDLVGPDAAGSGLDGDAVSEERFDRLKFYLKYRRYPDGADRAEKSRLRSAATTYKLVEGDKLMLKDKEVISDPSRQYEIARMVHVQHHGGINKTTAMLTRKYHWSQIKETVSNVIKNCAECKELGKTPVPPTALKRSTPVGGAGASPTTVGLPAAQDTIMGQTSTGVARDDILSIRLQPEIGFSYHDTGTGTVSGKDISSVLPPSPTLPSVTGEPEASWESLTRHNPMLQDQPSSPLSRAGAPHAHRGAVTLYQPIDPQIINQPSQHTEHHHHHLLHHPHHHHHHHHDVMRDVPSFVTDHVDEDSTVTSHRHRHEAGAFDVPGHHDDSEAETFQALLNADQDVGEVSAKVGQADDRPDLARRVPHHVVPGGAAAKGPIAGVASNLLERASAPSMVVDVEDDVVVEDRELDMLLEPQDDDDADDEDDERRADGAAGVPRADHKTALTSTAAEMDIDHVGFDSMSGANAGAGADIGSLVRRGLDPERPSTRDGAAHISEATDAQQDGDESRKSWKSILGVTYDVPPG